MNAMGTKGVLEYLGAPPLTGATGTRGQHWLRREVGDVLWLVLDRQGASMNTLDEAVLAELGALVDEAAAGHWRAVVLRSAKPSGFCAGADLAMFQGLASEMELVTRVAEANRVVDKLAALSAMTIAVVHGACLGGGLELALACDRIIARDDTTLGFPEVMVGLHPGLGGTARLTHRIQPIEAMKLMLTGRSLPAGKAKGLGLVDAVVPERNVGEAVRAALAGQMERLGSGAAAGALNLLPARLAIGRQLRAETQKRAPKQHYPAPHALIALWEKHGGDVPGMLAAEQASFARLLPLPETQNFIRDFFLRERLRANGKGKSEVRHVHVLGAGVMGAEIAAWCALKGMKVTLEDLSAAAIAKATAAAHALITRKLRGADALHALDRFVPDPRGHGLRHADMIIEAAPERMDLKRQILARLEAGARADAVLATNTSSLDLAQIAEGLKEPSRLVGIHFFNPVSKLELVEVVRHPKLDPDIVARAQRFVGAIGKLPLPVGNAPGFLVNRALMPYLGEALLMIDEGEQKERIDAAAVQFGMPMGPVELADQVGLDICLAVAETLAAGLTVETPGVPQWLRDKVAGKELGRKTGRGLYDYGSDGQPKKERVGKAPDAAMMVRLILPMLNAVAMTLEEGVVDDADSADAAMIFGTGFAPFRGGPIHYAGEIGFEKVAEALEELATRHGERFRPSGWWRKGG